MKRLLFVATFITLVSGCSKPPDTIRLPLEGAQGKKTASFYLGMIPGVQPHHALRLDEKGVQLRRSIVSDAAPELGELLDRLRQDDSLAKESWNEFAVEIDKRWNSLPPSLDALIESENSDNGTNTPFVLSVYGAMTTYRRDIQVPRKSLEDALLYYWDRGEKLIYPPGTTIIAYHKDERGKTVEVTAKRKREDGFWDFGVYGDDGQRTSRTVSPPTPYAAPTQCVGCHLGTMPYEPEASFLLEGDEPSGREYLLLDRRLRNEKVVNLLNEHARRSDNVLGVYGTVYLAEILSLPPAHRTPTQKQIVDLFKDRVR
jgi:hypothetical protein